MIFNDINRPYASESGANIDVLRSDAYHHSFYDNNYRSTNNILSYTDRDDISQRLALTKYKELVDNFGEDNIRQVSYSDNDGDVGNIMEHGDMFNRIFCITVNNH
jgi:hypothetical protein